VAGIGLIGRIDALEVGGHSLAFWGLGQVGVAIKGPTGVLFRRNALPLFPSVSSGIQSFPRSPLVFPQILNL
jgi:hypothetical protein